MSTDTPSKENVQHDNLAPHEALVQNTGDVEHTPRSEVPPALSVITPNATEQVLQHSDSSLSQEAAEAPIHDYFAPQPASTSANAAPALDLSARAHSVGSRSPTPSVGTSDATAAGHIEIPDTLHLSAGRPPPHTTTSSLSIESSASSATITPATSAHSTRPDLTTRKTTYPNPFPNQNFSALHSQNYPPYHLPSSLRRGPSQSPQLHTFASAIASLHSNGIRTSNNSPAASPNVGLFNAPGPPSAPGDPTEHSSGTYASPFLHFTHTHVPKETHVADVDVDPVSGRKLINHYEVIDELGRGTHGKVKLGRDLENPPLYVAIKIVERFSKRRKLGRLGTTEDKVKKEVAILKKARHPNIVALLEVIDDPSRKKVYIVLEWVEKGEIQWRHKAPKEIAMIEARRYEREKSGHFSDAKVAEDGAVLVEAQRRLAKQKRLLQRQYRAMKRGISDDPQSWSNEMAGDDESEDSQEDRLSRMSSLTAHSDAGRLGADSLGRRPSRTPSPLYPYAEPAEPAEPGKLATLTSEPEVILPTQDYDPARRSSQFSINGLEGSMYGSYDSNLGQTSRVASLHSLTSSRGSSEGLTKLAAEILDSELDPELLNVPLMAMEEVRSCFRDTLLGLQYLHHQGIVHRDIKPPNLLRTHDDRTKISDFGVSYLGRPVCEGETEDISEADATDLDDEAKELAKTVGTPAFYAPELCITDQQDDPWPVTKAIDVWALGVTLFCMLFARTPFVDNEFVVMRQIADEEIYVPRKRLLPVDTKPKSRPSSHGRSFPPRPSNRRHELDLIYEEIDDDLHDLLKRLLTRDPRQRVQLEEVRHHPWVIGTEGQHWLDISDPGHQAQGRKIEVSKEDVNTAVVPLNLVERAVSGLKKVFAKTGITRNRGTSNASSTKGDSPLTQAHSSSSSMSQDARRQSFRGDEQIFMALKSSREGEHPLANSVAASPEFNSPETEKYFDKHASYQDEPHGSANDLTRVSSRPMPGRAHTVASANSAAASMRTVTQSDFIPRDKGKESPPPSPGLPGTPTALISPGGSHLSGLFGQPGRILRSVRERSANRKSQIRGLSSDRGSIGSSDHHAEASIAVSQATAAGHVNPPEALRERTPGSSVQNSAHNSPPLSRLHSTISNSHNDSQHLSSLEPGKMSRLSSSSSIASIGKQVRDAFIARPQSRRVLDSSAEDWQRADEERVRKLVRESQKEVEQARKSPDRRESVSAFDNRTCPASPDDLRGKEQHDSKVPSVPDSSNPETPLEGLSPTAQAGQWPSALVSSSSDLGSAVSMSISNPSIPSVISEASSVDLSDTTYRGLSDEKRDPSSDDTLDVSPKTRSVEEHDEGYSPDQEMTFDSDHSSEYDSSSDSDNGLVMGRRKSTAKQGHGLVVSAETPKDRRGTGLSTRSKKSSRSGSNNTMKKVRTRDSIDEQRRHDIVEE